MEVATMPTYKKSMIFNCYHAELTVRSCTCSRSLERDAHGW